MIHPVVSDLLHRQAAGLLARRNEKAAYLDSLEADQTTLDRRIREAMDMIEEIDEEREAVLHAITQLNQEGTL